MDGVPLVSSTGPGAEGAALCEEARLWSPVLERACSHCHFPLLLLTSYMVQTLESRLAVLKKLLHVTQQFQSQYLSKERNAYVHTDDCP